MSAIRILSKGFLVWSRWHRERFELQFKNWKILDIGFSDPKNFGVWMETCGETYMLGNKPV